MKYMVEVNARFLVKIEIDGSCGAAEHYFLDKYPACWAANAFDEKSLDTDCFRGTLLQSELISEKELGELLNKTSVAMRKAEILENEMMQYMKAEQEMAKKLAELRAEIDEHKKALRDAQNDRSFAQAKVNWKKW